MYFNNLYRWSTNGKISQKLNEKIIQSRKGLRPFVENKFKDNNIVPSKEPDRGFYYDNEYDELLNMPFSNIIQYLKANLNINGLRDTIQLPINRRDN